MPSYPYGLFDKSWLFGLFESCRSPRPLYVILIFNHRLAAKLSEISESPVNNLQFIIHCFKGLMFFLAHEIIILVGGTKAVITKIVVFPLMF